MEKRGQFYLIGALIIVLVFAGFSYIYSDVREIGGNSEIYELADEINYEGGMIISNGVYLSESDDTIAAKINSSLFNFYRKSHPNFGIAFVYGDQTNAYLINSSGIAKIMGVSSMDISASGEYRQVEIKQGQKNFYVLIVEKIGEEVIVAVS